jgi:hypothetical protein
MVKGASKEERKMWLLVVGVTVGFLWGFFAASLFGVIKIGELRAEIGALEVAGDERSGGSW